MPPSASSKRPCRRRDGAGEGALFVAEQLALDERRRQRRAVDPDQRARVPAAAFVQRPGEQLLAGAGRSQQQHARVRRRDLRQPRQRQPQRRALADDVVEVVIGLDLFFQVDVVGLEPGVQLLDHRDVGAQRRLLPAALQRAARISRQQLQALDQQSRPASRQPAAVDHERADGRGRRSRPARRESNAHRSARLGAAGDRLPRQVLRPRDRHQLAAPQAVDQPVFRLAATRRAPPWPSRWPNTRASPRPTRRIRAAGTGRRGSRRRSPRGPRPSPRPAR